MIFLLCSQAFEKSVNPKTKHHNLICIAMIKAAWCLVSLLITSGFVKDLIYDIYKLCLILFFMNCLYFHLMTFDLNLLFANYSLTVEIYTVLFI